ncbi:MAG: phosphatidylglycerophosphatase A [Proteobacteria bacterium]|nr:phosphatidylglycerophosphatase A [Pseudomonadota bacterium]
MNALMKMIATGFGVGLYFRAPGTFGTLLALVPVYAMATLEVSHKFWIYIVVWLIAYLSVKSYEKDTQTHDSSSIVVDEILGFLTIFVFFEVELILVAIAFVLFRLFDILKPGPVGWIEKKLHGRPSGTLLDDVVAGGLVIVVLELMHYQMSA